ncbi:MAG: hypothetical protein LBM98_12225, partial [Oscillospiraceae bacterium]|nr:hypothetical protein [Oscillospiraceae bacterium]
KQSSAGGTTYVCYAPGTGLLRAYTLYVSQALRHFAKTGRAKPCPVPAHCAGTVDGVASARRGNHPAASRHPSQEGNLRWRAGLKPAPTCRYVIWTGLVYPVSYLFTITILSSSPTAV